MRILLALCAVTAAGIGLNEQAIAQYQNALNAPPPAPSPYDVQPVAYQTPSQGNPDQVRAQLASSVGLSGGGCQSCGGGSCTGCFDQACVSCASPGCGHCCPSKCCYGTCWHRTGVFGEYLFLQTRGIDLAYGVYQDGVGGPGTALMGEVGTLQYDHSSGYRVGFNYALDCCSSITTTFTDFNTSTTDSLPVTAFVVQPLVTAPQLFNAGTTSQAVDANYALDFQLVDVDYRAIWRQGNCWYLNYLLGLRYAHMDQDFTAVFPFNAPNGQETVFTDIKFDGFGLRFGLDGERRIFNQSGLGVYGKAVASLLGGQNNSSFYQVNVLNGDETIANWNNNRLISILELELGLAWTNCNGNVRVSAGYYAAIWGNMVTTPQFIDAVQQVNFTDVATNAHDTITFDGLVLRAEYRF